MLKYFRTIRKKLMEQNIVRSYIFYAIGEIFLVVIGILIALQVNNWNEERKERNREAAYLERLTENITSDLEVSKLNIKFYQEVLEAGTLSLSYATGNDVSGYSNWDILLAFFNASQIWPIITESSTYEELKSSGELSLLKSIDLRDRLAFYYGGAQFRYNQTIGINPPYRKLSRVKIPYSVQSYMWDNCHETIGDIQQLTDCEPGISEKEAQLLLQELKTDEELIGELSFWMSSIRAGWQPLLENVNLCNTILDEIKNYKMKL